MFGGMKKRLLQRTELTATSVIAPATSAMKMRGHRCEIDHEAPEINLLKKNEAPKVEAMPMSGDGPKQWLEDVCYSAAVGG